MAKSGDVFQQIQKRLESDLDEVVDDEERDRQEKKHYLFKMYQQLERYLKELPVEEINSGSSHLSHGTDETRYLVLQ
jgi:hypothetical protein